MKTFLKIAAALVLLALLVLPGAIGALTFETFEQEIDDFRKGAGVGTATGRSQRGWFVTTHVIDDPIMDPEAIELAVDFLGLSDIDELPVVETQVVHSHGPLPLLAPSRGGLRPALGVTNIEWFVRAGDARKRLPASMTIRTGVTRAHFIARLDPYDGAIGDGASVRFSGAKLYAESPVRRIDVVGRGDLGNVAIRWPDGELIGNDMPVEFRYRVAESGLADGSFGLKIALLSIEEQGASAARKRIALRNVTARGDSDASGGRYASKLVVALDELALPDNNMSDIRFDLIADIDGTHMAQMQALAADPSIADAQERMLQLAIDTLSRGARVTLNELAFTTDQGTLAGTFDAQLPAGLNDPQAMLGALVATGRVQVPNTLMNTLAADTPNGRDMLRYGLRSGMLKRNGTMLDSQFEFSAGKLQVNGVDVPLPF